MKNDLEKELLEYDNAKLRKQLSFAYNVIIVLNLIYATAFTIGTLLK